MLRWHGLRFIREWYGLVTAYSWTKGGRRCGLKPPVGRRGRGPRRRCSTPRGQHLTRKQRGRRRCCRMPGRHGRCLRRPQRGWMRCPHRRSPAKRCRIMCRVDGRNGYGGRRGGGRGRGCRGYGCCAREDGSNEFSSPFQWIVWLLAKRNEVIISGDLAHTHREPACRRNPLARQASPRGTHGLCTGRGPPAAKARWAGGRVRFVIISQGDEFCYNRQADVGAAPCGQKSPHATCGWAGRRGLTSERGWSTWQVRGREGGRREGSKLIHRPRGQRRSSGGVRLEGPISRLRQGAQAGGRHWAWAAIHRAATHRAAVHGAAILRAAIHRADILRAAILRTIGCGEPGCASGRGRGRGTGGIPRGVAGLRRSRGREGRRWRRRVRAGGRRGCHAHSWVARWRLCSGRGTSGERRVMRRRRAGGWLERGRRPGRRVMNGRRP
eukprot:scaffold5727_cov79-Isochrysis_galbana.AAC.1